MQIEFQNELRGAGTRSLKIDRRIAVPAIQAPCAMQHSHSGWCNRTHSADLRAPTLTTNNVESTVHLGACREFGHKRFGQRSAIASQLRRSGHDHESLWTGRLQSASECDIRVLDDFRCRGRVVPPSLRNCLRIDGQLKWVTGNDYSVRSRTGKEAKHVLPLLLAERETTHTLRRPSNAQRRFATSRAAAGDCERCQARRSGRLERLHSRMQAPSH